VTTYEVDHAYEASPDGSWKVYLGAMAIISYSNDDGHRIRYHHKDRLGTSLTFSDENGQVVGRRHYDAFGKPRMIDGTLMEPGARPRLKNFTDYAGVNNIGIPRRGFTDHLHLDDVELIHMNGRVYDYNLGRFMSVDPFIQSPTNSQSINPYSYIMNNPLSGTDPTGYASCSVDDAAGCQDVAEDLGKGETADVTQKQSVTGSRIKRDVKVGTMTGNGNGTVNIQIGNMSATADIGTPSTTAKGNNSTNYNQIYSDTASTIANGAAAAIGNLIPDMANGIADWTERFLHQDSGFLGRMGQWVDVDNEVAQGVANDFRKVGSVLLANTPLRASSSASMRLPSGGLSGNMVAQPKLLWGRNAEQIAAILTAEGYQVAVRQSTRGSGNATIIKVGGHKQVTQIQVHAGGGRHGGAYYKISTSTQGRVWVVNPATFRADPNQKGTIVSGVN